MVAFSCNWPNFCISVLSASLYTSDLQKHKDLINPTWMWVWHDKKQILPDGITYFEKRRNPHCLSCSYILWAPLCLHTDATDQLSHVCHMICHMISRPLKWNFYSLTLAASFVRYLYIHKLKCVLCLVWYKTAVVISQK